jgi:hypothetical protein
VAAAVVTLAIAIGAFMMQKHAPQDSGTAVSKTVKAESTASPLAIVKPDSAPQRGRIAVNAFPWGEITMVRNLSDGKPVEFSEKIVTPASIDLAAGRYEVTMTNPGYDKPVTRVVEVAGGESRDVMFEFESASNAPYPFEGEGR